MPGFSRAFLKQLTWTTVILSVCLLLTYLFSVHGQMYVLYIYVCVRVRVTRMY